MFIKKTETSQKDSTQELKSERKFLFIKKAGAEGNNHQASSEFLAIDFLYRKRKRREDQSVLCLDDLNYIASIILRKLNFELILVFKVKLYQQK